MKSYCTLEVVIIIFLSACQTKITGTGWQEKDDVLIMEAEAGVFDASTSGWKKETDFKEFHGNGYVVWRGEGDWGPEKRVYDSISNTKHIISYTFQITNPGVYYVKVLNYHLKEDGDNDVWVSVDKGDWEKTYDWQINEWTFDERGEWAKYKFDKGIHQVQMAGRSRGFAVDQIIIFEESMKDKFLPITDLNRKSD